jgi:hypothetical protein
VQPREDLVGLVDDHQVEGCHGAEPLRAAFAACELAADQVHARREEARLVLAGLDAEQSEQLVLPLPDQRLRDDQQDALRAFGPALGDDQSRLDCFAQPDFISEDAAALAETPQREDHRVDLVGIGVDARLPLRRGIAFPVVGTADADEILGEDALVEGVKGHGSGATPTATTSARSSSAILRRFTGPSDTRERPRLRRSADRRGG